ncbi:hypothetical protein FRC06_004831 [Ceratobasidium sp. 370]|nr:hypothetical protein FRC06_004831 [Ceratobasidium sp. 370]
MAKSMRSKSKRSFRRTKRESGVFAAADAARLERLNRKLAAKLNADKDGDAPMEEEEQAEVQEGKEVAEVEGEGSAGGYEILKEELEQTKEHTRAIVQDA